LRPIHEEITAPFDFVRRAGQKPKILPELTQPAIERLDGQEAAEEASAKPKIKYLSDWVEKKLYINRRPMSLAGRDYIKWVYDKSPDYPVGSRNILLCCGRQTEKSSSLAAKAIALGAIHEAFNTLIIHPRFDQVSMFSQQRFQPMCADSPEIATKYMSTSCVWQVSSREFINRSFYNFKSCYYSADPIRGISAHHVTLDEVQDLLVDNLPVIMECQSHVHPDLRYVTKAGTPKTTSNALSLQWKDSCQYEWLVRCEACNHYNFLDERVIGKTCYICSKCGRPINVASGLWVSMRPSLLDVCWGFRISQIMVPFMYHSDVFRKMNDPNFARRRFYNECLGLPYDIGQLVLTREDILSVCEPRPMITPSTSGEYQVNFLVAGLDHGVGEYSASGDQRVTRKHRPATSFTAISIGAFCTDNVFRVLKTMRFTGESANLANQPAVINQIIREYGVRWVMSDWGFGAQTNARLVSDFGWNRIEAGSNPVLLECQYHGGTTPVAWNSSAFRYMVSRNWAIELGVDAIKSKRLQFFRREQMEEFIDDYTSMYAEFDYNFNRLIYGHTTPDDCFQATVYAYLAALQQRGSLVQTLVPNLGPTEGFPYGEAD